MSEVTLIEVLNSREERAKKQKELLGVYQYPLICFTMNIAGPIKTSPLIERSFFEGIRLLKEHLSENDTVYEEVKLLPTGCEAYLSVNDTASNIKEICTSIEESARLGRLFDIDVIDKDGKKLERKLPRSCLVCGKPGRECSAGRIHSVDELQSVTNKIMEEYFFPIDKEQCSSLAVKSLLDEVYTTPKPGLVDRRNNGSHTDMDITTFERSAKALKPYFSECFSIGKRTSGLSLEDAFSVLRKAGVEAEKAMFNATRGVNTHKGAIYSMGILCASVGRLWRVEKPFAGIYLICKECAEIVKESVKNDFENIDNKTAGGRLYLQYGIKGIRGEVLSGFSSVLNISLPIYCELLKNNYSENDAGAISLLYLIAHITDTNLCKRGGIKGAEDAMKQVQELLIDYPYPDNRQIEVLDDAFIAKNLSPGGCADLLSVTYFLYAISVQENKKGR